VSGYETAIYRRGKYWLDWDRRADGSLRSPNLTIFWYDADVRRTRSASTGTAAEEEGVIALDRRYLADRGEAAAYCHACGQPIARGDRYLLTDAIADYRLEVGDARSSGAAIASRLNHVLNYIEAEQLTEATCADAALPTFANKFRAWSRLQPVENRNRAGVVTFTRSRAISSTEACLAQLAAVLNHAVSGKRSDTPPDWKVLAPQHVNRVRRTRTGVSVIADMLEYAAEPNKRRGGLHGFLIGSICTIARPGAIVELSTDPARNQWQPDWDIIDLNPAGRPQNKKRRPTLPVLPLLRQWLLSVHADTSAEDPKIRSGGWLVNFYGRPVQNVETAWDAMLEALKLPQDRDWKTYLLRHSVATLVRGAGVQKWELEAYMGHRSASQTETYAVEQLFPNVQRALQGLLDELESRVAGALHRNGTGNQPT
jgi:hypothetical protein